MDSTQYTLLRPIKPVLLQATPSGLHSAQDYAPLYPSTSEPLRWQRSRKCRSVGTVHYSFLVSAMLRDSCGMEYGAWKNDRVRPSLLSVWVEERTRRKASHGQFVQKRRVLEAWLMEIVLERHVFTCGRS